jgi:ParB-like chromosome segregation protein Spo0J
LAVIHDGALKRGSKGRHWTFIEAYVHELPIAEIAAQTGKTPHATVELLRRASTRLEGEILRRLDLPEAVRRRALAPQPLDRSSRTRVRDALRGLAETGDSVAGAG